LPTGALPTKLPLVTRFVFCLFVVLGTAAGCGGANGGPTGTDGDPLTEQSSYTLSCTIGALVLEIPIELFYELDRPYIEGGSATLTFSAAITFEEQTATALIDAGTSKIDIFSVEIATLIDGATPSMVETSWAAAPFNDFDLDVDTDDNGVAGPHRVELDTATIATTVIEGADEVELGLGLEQVFLDLGDFEVPGLCLSPTLVGFTARFPVGPAP